MSFDKCSDGGKMEGRGHLNYQEIDGGINVQKAAE